MNISEMVQSSGWKNFMAKLYGFGASVVIIGALFKIQHWPFAGPMLILGLSTEAVIFFFSAFEPLHEELDWTLVYPELAGMTDPDEMENYKEGITSGRTETVLERFDQIMDNAELKPETITRLGETLSKLNQSAVDLTDISAMSGSTRQYVNNFQSAAESLNNMTTFYGQSTEALSSSVSHLSQSYEKSASMVEQSAQSIAQQVNTSGAQLTSSYSRLAESVNAHYNSISDGNKNYGSQLEGLNKNLSALNAVYELQLQGTNEHLKENQKLYSGMNQLLQDLNESVNDTNKYRTEISKLGDNLATLNTIYGNMLSAMNVVNKK